VQKDKCCVLLDIWTLILYTYHPQTKYFMISVDFYFYTRLKEAPWMGFSAVAWCVRALSLVPQPAFSCMHAWPAAPPCMHMLVPMHARTSTRRATCLHFCLDHCYANASEVGVGNWTRMATLCGVTIIRSKLEISISIRITRVLHMHLMATLGSRSGWIKINRWYIQLI
jgi:hypothetical protein